MRLVVDANVLVGELLRNRGRNLLTNVRLDLLVTERQWEEAQHELSRRMQLMIGQGRLSRVAADHLFNEAMRFGDENLSIITETTYDEYESIARRRIPRDPDDWPVVALALALGSDIWTLDADFLGCGVATWTTETLATELAEQMGWSS